jgi:hypothetical protein
VIGDEPFGVFANPSTQLRPDIYPVAARQFRQESVGGFCIVRAEAPVPKIVDGVREAVFSGDTVKADRTGEDEAELGASLGQLAKIPEPLQETAHALARGIVTGDGQHEDRKLVDKDQPRLLRLQNSCEGAVGLVLPFPRVAIDINARARDLDTPRPPAFR